MNRRALCSLPVVCAAALLVPRALWANDPFAALGQGDLALHADELEIDWPRREATLRGNVSLQMQPAAQSRQGALSLRCAQLDLRFNAEPRVTWARGKGNVHAELRGVRASAPEVLLDLEAQRMDLGGGVTLRSGEATLRAERASVDLRSGKITLSQVKGAMPAKRDNKQP